MRSNQQEGESDGHVVMRGGSEKESDSEGSQPELFALMMETRHTPKDD